MTNSGQNNLYVGTFTDDGNYSSYEEFKFLFTRADLNTWESIPNRTFFLTNDEVLPIVYFSNLGNAVPVKFQVDMGVQVAAGRLNSADVVECQGTFNGWAGGFVLTNNPAAANSNLYSGTTFVFDTPGTREFYKFVVNGGFSGLGWESPASSDTRDRSFILAPGGQTLPLVLWSDWTASDVLPAATMVTFRLNMTNAIGSDGHIFDPGNDFVVLNGDWLPWWGWYQPPFELLLTNNLIGSLVYSLTLAFPQGYSVPLNYKYSINGGDNEAGFATNHFRFIRATGSYSLPMDTFGNPTRETSFGNLRIARPAGGQAAIKWLGRPSLMSTRIFRLTGSCAHLRFFPAGKIKSRRTVKPRRGGMFIEPTPPRFDHHFSAA